MMTVKLKDAVESTDILRQLAGVKLKGRAAFNVAKMLKQLEDELNLFNETRTKLIQQYADKDENGELKINPDTNEYMFSDENMNKFVEEINGVLNGEIEVNANKLRLEDLEDSDFTPVQMMALEAFVEE
jgi:uncharacterized membrane-anchored protein